MILFTVSDTSVASIAPKARMRTGAGVFVCPVQHRVQTAVVTHAALPAILATSSMVPVPKYHFHANFVTTSMQGLR